MALFEFKLKPLQEVMPWGQEPNLSLSWFGLTDGIYYMNVGNEQLFRNTKEILWHWKQEYPHTDKNQPFVDYPIVRFYEDLLEKLADIMQPVPQELQKYIVTSERWSEQVWGFCYDNESDENWDMCSLAAEWCGYYRHVSTMHLAKAPSLVLWRIDDTIHIRWDNGDNKIDGIPCWTTTRGEYTLSADEFMQEVESFHQRLMEEMEQRVHLINTNNPFDPRVKIDIPNLIKEHEQRKNSLAEAMQRKPSVEDWSTVIDATEKLAMLLLRQFPNSNFGNCSSFLDKITPPASK